MPPPGLLPRDRLHSLLDAAARRRIAVVGDAMLDVYLRGDVDRISPEAPVPVLRVRERKFALGGAANVAQNVAALGAMLEAIGADARALVCCTPRPTTTKTRIVARIQQIVRFDEEEDGDLGA